ncbi:hypothetical protein POPTR_001G407650v4 [Populus trichocarpa]|uniref:Uncharacterized protein n=1 Tax=Populus trichocarpa TaxID=3694 RepID=A0ACC0TP38_POPTR|nr:hypothetical protein POPTR_001G407650v4 [Populus trichocarpa]
MQCNADARNNPVKKKKTREREVWNYFLPISECLHFCFEIHRHRNTLSTPFNPKIKRFLKRKTCQGMMLQIRFEYLLQRIVI